MDHVLPRSLSNEPIRLSEILAEYEIFKNIPDFSIDGLSNMVPTHGPSCNLRKSDSILPKPAILLFLSETQSKLPKVMAELELLTTIAERGDVLGRLAKLLEGGQLSEREVEQIIREWEFRKTQDEPLVVTFGLNFAAAMEMRGLEALGPSGYATACDRLESELTEAIRLQNNQTFHFAEASARNGETLSVRIVFPELDINDIDVLPLGYIERYLPWWELLEISNFYRVYGLRYPEAISG